MKQHIINFEHFINETKNELQYFGDLLDNFKYSTKYNEYVYSNTINGIVFEFSVGHDYDDFYMKLFIYEDSNDTFGFEFNTLLSGGKNIKKFLQTGIKEVETIDIDDPKSPNKMKKILKKYNFSESDFNESKNVNEAGHWETESKYFNKDFYNFWASLDLISSNISRYMDDMNKGKQQDALFSLRVAYEELVEMTKTKEMKKFMSLIHMELVDKNVLRESEDINEGKKYRITLQEMFDNLYYNANSEDDEIREWANHTYNWKKEQMDYEDAKELFLANKKTKIDVNCVNNRYDWVGNGEIKNWRIHYFINKKQYITFADELPVM